MRIARANPLRSRLFDAKTVVIVAGLLLFGGCAAIDDSYYRCAMQAHCEYAWLRTAKNPLQVVWPSHFGHGWKAGYHRVLTGGSAETPTVPPDEYWASKYHNPQGQEAIEAWYQGFAAGARLAAEENVGQYHYVRPFQPSSAAAPPTLPTESELAAPETLPELNGERKPRDSSATPGNRPPVGPKQFVLPPGADAPGEIIRLPPVDGRVSTSSAASGWR